MWCHFHKIPVHHASRGGNGRFFQRTQTEAVYMICFDRKNAHKLKTIAFYKSRNQYSATIETVVRTEKESRPADTWKSNETDEQQYRPFCRTPQQQ